MKYHTKLICMDDFDDIIRKINQVYPPASQPAYLPTCLRRNRQRRRNGDRRAPGSTRLASVTSVYEWDKRKELMQAAVHADFMLFLTTG